jgi:biotin operon repressor
VLTRSDSDDKHLSAWQAIISDYTSGRQLAKDLGKSHEFVYKYLEEMRGKGVI